MKRLSVVLLLLGLAGCNYPSRRQAEIGCNVWADRNREVTFVETIPAKPYKSTLEQDIQKVKDERNPKDGSPAGLSFYTLDESIDNLISVDKWKKEDSKEKKIPHQVTARWCYEEEETNQFLGYENLRATKGTWENKKGMTLDEKVVKHFRY